MELVSGLSAFFVYETHFLALHTPLTHTLSLTPYTLSIATADGGSVVGVCPPSEVGGD